MKAFVYRNNNSLSIETCARIEESLKARNITVLNSYDESVDFLVCIGGDGTFLSFIHKLGFPTVPILSINTGNLGFFQEASPSDAEKLIDAYLNGDYKTQCIHTIEAEIQTDRDTFIRNGINEIVIRGPLAHVSQYRVEVESTPISDFSGDGILVSTPVGSTAYNYSLGGSLVSPNLDVLQITPIAPMNTNTYRCFHSSVIIPSDETITVCGLGRSENGNVILSFDGRTHEFNNVKRIRIKKSQNELHLVRFSDYNYWKKLKSKLV